jgi:hypothetical protein
MGIDSLNTGGIEKAGLSMAIKLAHPEYLYTAGGCQQSFVRTPASASVFSSASLLY